MAFDNSFYESLGHIAMEHDAKNHSSYVSNTNWYAWNTYGRQSWIKHSKTIHHPQSAVHSYIYDGWNLAHETIEVAGGAMSEIQYFWGNDLSGTLQGAGGVGGLLAVSIGGQFYLPCLDANGNVTAYIDESGTVVASYEYDAFGDTIAQTGSHADAFRFRFSTKYHDPETGLYYYGRRFYDPPRGRWLNRDPIEEDVMRHIRLQ